MASTAEEQNVELVRRGMEAYNRGDLDTVLEMLSPEVEVFAPTDVMNSGTFHGHAGWLEWTREWNEAWESFEIQVKALDSLDERFILADVQQRGLGRGSGVEVELDVTWLFEIRADRCAYMAIHLDRERALADAQRRQAAP